MIHKIHINKFLDKDQDNLEKIMQDVLNFFKQDDQFKSFLIKTRNNLVKQLQMGSNHLNINPKFKARNLTIKFLYP